MPAGTKAIVILVLGVVFALAVGAPQVADASKGGGAGHRCDDVSLAPASDWVAVNVRATHVKCGPARKVVRDVAYDRGTPYRCSTRPGPPEGLTSTLIRCVNGRRVVAWKQY